MELVVAMAIGTITVLALAVILVNGQKSLNRTLRQANLQRDMSRTMLMMKKFIRSGESAEVSQDANEVIIRSEDDWVRFSYVQSHRDLRFQAKGDKEETTLLDGIVEKAFFELDYITNKKVTVSLDLTNSGSEAHMSSITTMRNYLEGS